MKTRKTNTAYFLFIIFSAFVYFLIYARDLGQLASNNTVLNIIVLLIFGLPVLFYKYQLDILLIFVPVFLFALKGIKGKTLRIGYCLTLLVFSVLVLCNVYKNFQKYIRNYDESTQLLIGTKELHLTENDSNSSYNYWSFTFRSAAAYIKHITGNNSKSWKVLKHYNPQWTIKVIPLLLLDIIMIGYFILEYLKNKGRFRYTIL